VFERVWEQVTGERREQSVTVIGDRLLKRGEGRL